MGQWLSGLIKVGYAIIKRSPRMNDLLTILILDELIQFRDGPPNKLLSVEPAAKLWNGSPRLDQN